jgi:hypothetical protein
MASSPQTRMYEDTAHMLAIETRVGALEVGIKELSASTTTQFSALMSKLDERSKINWPVIISSGALLMTLMGSLSVAIWSPIRETISRLDTTQATIQQNMVTRLESEMWAKVREEQFRTRDEADKVFDTRIRHLEAKIFGF